MSLDLPDTMADVLRVSLPLLRCGVPALLLPFLLRRLLLLGASLLPRGETPLARYRTVTVLVAARNEAGTLPRLLSALERLDYPASLLHVVLISDGSDDDTEALMRAWDGGAASREMLALPQSRGKGAALAAGLARAPQTDVVVVFDADCEPAPDALPRLVGALDDASVGGVAAFPRPSNAHAGVVARYAALERYVHHVVALAGRDRLGLDPPLVGVAFAVRRRALDDVGGFPTDRLAEDTALSLALVHAGWRLRWLGEAQVREDVVETRARFRVQRQRWSRGLLESASQARSLEERMAAMGYLDRIVLLVAILLVPFGVAAPWWPIAYLSVPALAALRALHRAGDGPVHAFAWAALLMFALDVYESVRSLVGHLTRARVAWGERDGS